MWREWIEIGGGYITLAKASPSMRREWIEMTLSCRVSAGLLGLPPCGGSGLKYHVSIDFVLTSVLSPSMRREWIEMHRQDTLQVIISVSLHAVGVD